MAREIKTIAIIGGGLMGGGIAQVAIMGGLNVILNDISMEFAEKSKAGIVRWLNKDVTKGRISSDVRDAAIERLTLSADLADVKDVDLVIEAIPENLELKKNLFAKLSDLCDEDIVLATNTSAISISAIAAAVKNPERVCGMHFVSPVPLMPLMELVKSITTSEETVATAKKVAEQMGKSVIIAKESPGFIINRMLNTMLNQAATLVELGIGSVEDVDAAMRVGLNHPMGPLEIMDMAGVNVTLAALTAMYEESHDPAFSPSMLIRRMVNLGWCGRKTGKGFYIYHEDGTKTPNPDL